MAQVWVHSDDGTPCYFGAYTCHSYGCDLIALADIPDYQLHQSASPEQLAAALTVEPLNRTART